MTYDDEPGVGPAHPDTIKLWLEAIKSMGPDELDSFERQTFKAWFPSSLGDVRRAIERRRELFR